jgi:cyclophilin family peptidyl-prolyl cis-trans isomerase
VKPYQPGASLQFQSPKPLSIGRLVFDIDTSAGLTKTCANFVSLCKGDKGMCKNAPSKPLHYKGTAIHRIAKDFVVQGGDVTRNDGSGGEVSKLLVSASIDDTYFGTSRYMEANLRTPRRD